MINKTSVENLTLIMFSLLVLTTTIAYIYFKIDISAFMNIFLGLIYYIICSKISLKIKTKALKNGQVWYNPCHPREKFKVVSIIDGFIELKINGEVEEDTFFVRIREFLQSYKIINK